MRGLKAIHVKVVVGKGGAAHRRHQDGAVGNAQLVQHLAHQPMGNAVVAAGAIVGGALIEHGICIKNQAFALGGTQCVQFLSLHDYFSLRA